VLAPDQIEVHPGTRHPDAGALDLTGEVRHDATELGAPGQPLRQQDLAADATTGLVQRDPMAALGRHGRRLEPARPTADDEHVPDADRRDEPAVPELAPALGELDARDRVPRVEVADTRLVAPDARADLVGPALAGLDGQERIADQRSRHDARVGLPELEDALGLLGLVDATGDDHRDGDHGWPGPRAAPVRAGQRHRRHDVSEPASVAEVPATTLT
jgi:hypothetical protein